MKRNRIANLLKIDGEKRIITRKKDEIEKKTLGKISTVKRLGRRAQRVSFSLVFFFFLFRILDKVVSFSQAQIEECRGG